MDKMTQTLAMQSGTLFLSLGEQEKFEERAAIMEFEGGMSRSEAEQAALELILKSRLLLNKVV